HECQVRHDVHDGAHGSAGERLLPGPTERRVRHRHGRLHRFAYPLALRLPHRVSWPSDDQIRDWLLIPLTLVAGWVDAVAYVSLGHVFTANMTGNLVLLGINAGEDQLVAAIRSAVALACFALGALLGGLITRRTRPGGVWPRQATLAMTAEL